LLIFLQSGVEKLLAWTGTTLAVSSQSTAIDRSAIPFDSKNNIHLPGHLLTVSGILRIPRIFQMEIVLNLIVEKAMEFEDLEIKTFSDFQTSLKNVS